MRKKRVVFGVIVIIMIFAVLILRMVDLQIFNGELMNKKAAASGAEYTVLKAVRGEILDRNSALLVSNESTFYITADSSADENSFAEISGILNETITKDDRISGQPFIFAQNITKEQALAFSEAKIKGVKVNDGYRRKSAGVNASHVVGTVGGMTEEEYVTKKAEGYGMADSVGKSGVEKFAESYLRGKDGERMVYKDGRTEEIPPSDGCFVRLCLDKALQKKCEDELKYTVDEVNRTKNTNGGGAAVVVDVSNGDVLAMCSYPDYDISGYSEIYGELLSDKRNPLLNRCISGCFEPGSVFKPVVALAALSEGKVSADEKIYDEGIYKYYAPSYTPSCYIWANKRKTHGNVNVSSALSESCNYFFYEIGRRTGIEKISEYAKKFGLGEKTGIEIDGEAAGCVASPKTKKDWLPGDTLQAAIGQSVNMFTPLSLARYTAAVANGGTLYKPHVVKDISDYDGNIVYESKTEVSAVVKIKPEYFDEVKKGMKMCCESGTAKEAFFDKKFTAGGKTGTAQVPSGPENGLFIGFAPYDNPEIAVCVVIEHGGGTSASRAASEIMSEWVVTCGNR